MKKYHFTLNRKDANLQALVQSSDQRTLASWAIACVERVLPYFDQAYPTDYRPQQALNTLQNWIQTGQFTMSVIRSASLNAHAAAREIELESPARSAARAAGQAVTTAHVPAHALAAANYALQAICFASDPETAEAAVASEAHWQYQRLIELTSGNKN